MTRAAKLVLTASILLNLLLAGAMAGMMMREAGRHWPDRADLDRMTADGRQLTHRSFETSRRGIEPLFAQAHELRAKMIANLNAAAFDPVAFQDDSAALRAVQAKIMTERARVAGTVASQLGRTDRQAIAEWLAGTRPPPDAPKGDRPAR